MNKIKIYSVSISICTVFVSFLINSSNAHLTSSFDIQIWNDTEDNITIEFGYSPEKPIIDTFTNLAFSVTNLRTGDHLAEGTAQITVTNGPRLFRFQNVTLQNGDFSVDYLFPDDGTHQVLLRLDRNDSINLASFQVFVPHQTPPDLLSNAHNLIIGLGLISAVGVITIIIIRRK